MPDSEPWLRRGRIPSLDGVRAIAIVMVLLAHGRASHGCPSLGWWDWITTTGLLGVEVFFALSGFLITLLMLREFERSGRLNLGAFYLRRMMRIFPAYIALLLAVAWLEHRGLAFPTRADWIAALTYTMNFRSSPNTHFNWELMHLWSLSIEEQFYLGWPLVLAITPRRFRLILPLLGLAVALGSRALLVLIFTKHIAGVRGWTFCRIDSIAAGCLLAIMAFEPRARLMLDRMARFRGIGILFLMALWGSVWLSRTWLFYDSTLSYSVNAICITALIWWLASRHQSIAGCVLNLHPIAALGTLSYSLYLWQELFLNRERDYFWTRFPQNIAFTFIAAGLSYCVIEWPFLRLKDHLGAARHGSVAAPPKEANG